MILLSAGDFPSMSDFQPRRFDRPKPGQEWVEQPVHKEIGEAVAKIYRESRAEGGAGDGWKDFCACDFRLLSHMKDGDDEET